MACASRSRSPSVSAAFWRSLPARSTSTSLERRVTTQPLPSSTTLLSTAHCITCGAGWRVQRTREQGWGRAAGV